MMNKFIVSLGVLCLFGSVQAVAKPAVVDPVARDKAIEAIESFSAQMQRADPNYTKIEERLVVMVPVMKKRYSPQLWDDRFRFLYYALTESDRADLRKAPPKPLHGQKIEHDKLLELYIAQERSLADDIRDSKKLSDKQAAEKRLQDITDARNTGKIGLVEAIGREYAVVMIYYPDVEPLIKMMRERIELLSRLNQGEISRGRFEILVSEQRKNLDQYR